MDGQSFTLTTCCWCEPPLTHQLLLLFLVFWPFITLMFLRTRRCSPMPLLAMLLPIALAMCGTWISLGRVIQVMAISGGGRAATAAGIAEALVLIVGAVFSALFVGLFALMRRHRPVTDHFTNAIALAVAAEVVAALLFTGWIAPERRQITLALIWAGAALVIALTITARMAWYHRFRSNESSPVAA